MKFAIKINSIYRLPSVPIIVGEATHLSFKGKVSNGKKVIEIESALDGNIYKDDVTFSVLNGTISNGDIGSTFTEVA